MGQSVFQLRERKENVGRSVGYIHTGASACFIVNHCAAPMSPKAKSRGTRDVNIKHFFSVARQWASDNHNKAPLASARLITKAITRY